MKGWEGVTNEELNMQSFAKQWLTGDVVSPQIFAGCKHQGERGILHDTFRHN